MLFALAAVIAVGLYLQTSQSSETPEPIVQLVSDLEAAIPRAHLSDTQKQQVETDSSVLKAASQARQQGLPVDRQQVVAAVKDLHKILESGSFSTDDQKKLNADIAVLRKQ